MAVRPGSAGRPVQGSRNCAKPGSTPRISRRSATLAGRIQEQAFEDLPYYPLGLYYNPTAYRADLIGVLDGGPFFWNVRRG
jgi:hypothetical protein